MVASYVNYYTGNGFIALPVVEPAVPVIEPIYAREILLGGGNVHCITQQVPAKK